MPGVCILTDSTAQFTAASFPGQELVSVIPLHIYYKDHRYVDGKDLKISDLPPSARNPSSPVLQPPSPDEFRQIFLRLGNEYDEIIAILLTPNLNRALPNAREAEYSLGWAPVTLIDSQTTGVGLGLLVQAAAEAAQEGASGLEIKRFILNQVSRVYSIYCVQSLTYLSQAGHLDIAQAVVGEMLGVLALFILENGNLVPVQKARNVRQLVDLLYEFAFEFGNLKHIALDRGLISFENEARILRERIGSDFPSTPYSEHILGPALACIFGPRSIGLVAMEE
jgi:DegV family protein with EDD domain